MVLAAASHLPPPRHSLRVGSMAQPAGGGETFTTHGHVCLSPCVRPHACALDTHACSLYCLTAKETKQQEGWSPPPPLHERSKA